MRRCAVDNSRFVSQTEANGPNWQAMSLPSKQATATWNQVWICLGLALITLAVFGPTVRYSFLDYDDETYVTTNPHVLSGLTCPE
jgi:hypothetical protein